MTGCFVSVCSSYLSERETADRNFALGYYMKENDVCILSVKICQSERIYKKKGKY